MTKTPTTSLNPGTRRVQMADGTFRYVGQVRCGGDVVAECGHEHRNRDMSSKTNGTSATDCVRDIINGAQLTSAAEYIADRIRTRWQRTSAAGFVAPREPAGAAEQRCAAAAAAYLDAVAKARAAHAAAAAPPPKVPPAAEPQQLGDMPDWML